MRKPNKLVGCQVFNEKNAPTGWILEPLGDRIELAYGRALPEDRRKQGTVVVYGSNGPVGNHNAFFVPAPGVLVGRKGTVGAVHFAENDFWPIDTVYYVKPIKGDDLHFIHYLLQYLPLERLNAATGVPGLSRRDVYALNGVFPQLTDQKVIADVFARLDKEIANVCVDVVNQKALKTSIFSDEKILDGGPVQSYAGSLITLKMSLMDAVFSGRLPISSLANVLEENI